MPSNITCPGCGTICYCTPAHMKQDAEGPGPRHLEPQVLSNALKSLQTGFEELRWGSLQSPETFLLGEGLRVLDHDSPHHLHSSGSPSARGPWPRWHAAQCAAMREQQDRLAALRNHPFPFAHEIGPLVDGRPAAS